MKQTDVRIKIFNEIYYKLRNLKSHGRFNLYSFVEAIKEAGIELNFDDLGYIQKKYFSPRELSTIISPSFIPEFIISYLKDTSIKSMLDIWPGMGSLIIPISQKLKLDNFLALCINEKQLKISKLLDSHNHIKWRIGDPFLLLEDIGDTFDIILGMPPWRTKHSEIELGIDGDIIKIRDEQYNLLLLKGALKLSKKGIAFFIVSPRFISYQGEKSVYSNLYRFGLYVDAIISIPAGTFAPITNIQTYLLIIKKEKPQNLFVGELYQDKKNRQTLLKNLKLRKEGKTLHLGALINHESFTSFNAFILEKEIESLAHKFNLSAVDLAAITTEINSPSSKLKNGFNKYKNCVYLPRVGPSPAIDSLSDLKIKSQNYWQIVLKPETGDAKYVADFLNTHLGNMIRKSLSSGYITTITKNSLLRTKIYLPDLKTQKGIVKVKSLIKELENQLKTYEQDLTKYPKKISDIEEKISILREYFQLANLSDSITGLIARGESTKLEFKSTLRKNLKTKQIDKKIEHSVLKTIVAFLNTNGGILLVGVSDDHKVVGIEIDDFPSIDKFLLHFKNLIKDKIGLEFINLITYKPVQCEGKHILRVDCKESTKPVFLKTSQKKEEFYVRSGPSSDKLEGSQLIEYVKSRFQKIKNVKLKTRINTYD